MKATSFRGAVPAGNAGMWGPITSSVDWCEKNYVYFSWVAEFWNSLSSFAMVAVGLAGMFLNRSVLETRFLLAFFFVALLGLGSVLFHASLKHETQMCDELPMLYAVFTTLFIVLDERVGNRFPLAALLIVWSVVTSAATVFAAGETQFALFHLSFGSAEFYSLYRVYCIYRKHRMTPGAAHGNAGGSNLALARLAKAESDVSHLFKCGMASYVIGLAVWVTDLKNCWLLQKWWPAVSGLPNPQLHAWWHVFVSLGFYYLITLTAYDRLLSLTPTSMPVVIKWKLRVLPYLRLPKGKKALS
jgi:dihydroceramidase